MTTRIISTVAIAASILCVGAGAVAAQPTVRPLTVAPRFKIEAVSVKAIDQAGVDWWGSDDVFAITTAAGVVMRTETLKSIKTGQTHMFKKRLFESRKLDAKGKKNPQNIFDFGGLSLVAGAGFEPATFGL